jgi:hypothetical protein
MKKLPAFTIITILTSTITFACYSREKDMLQVKIDEYMNRVNKSGFLCAILVAKDGKMVLSKG